MSKPDKQKTQEAKKFVTKQSELADILGVSRRTISRWIKDLGGVAACVTLGMIKSNGRYVIKAWIAYAELRADDGDDGSDPTQTAAKAEQVLIQNERLRLKLGREKDELIPSTSSKEIFGKLLLAAKTRSYSSVIRIVTLARMAPNTTEATEKVKQEIDELWRPLSDSSSWMKTAKAPPQPVPQQPTASTTAQP